MTYYFKLQIHRAFRFLVSIGFNPYLVLVFFVLAFVFLSHMLFYKLDSASHIYTGLALYLIMSTAHSERNSFIQSLFSKSRFFQIRLIENIVLSSPFVIFLCVKGFWIHAFGVFAGGIMLSVVSPRMGWSYALPTPFSKHPFEFIVGFRKYVILLLVALAVLCIAIYVDNFNLGLVVLGFSLLLTTSFYSDSEDQFYIWVHQHSPQQFLKRKIKVGLRQLAYLNGFQSLVLLLFYPEYWWLISVVVCIGFSLLAVSILMKYAYFPQTPELFQGVALVGCIVFPPLALVIVPMLYKKASTNLENILC